MSKARKAHHLNTKLMGCRFVITAVDTCPQKSWDAIRAAYHEINRIENLISSWKSDSQTTAINNEAGKREVKVSPELFNLIERSMKISELTKGSFDITGTVARYFWKFRGETQTSLSDDQIYELKGLINYKNVILNEKESTVYLKKTGMKIGFGGIGKGYAAQRASQIMKDWGIESGVINAAGDLMCWGTSLNAEGWEISIPSPQNRSNGVVRFTIPEGSVVTSGDYEHYVMIEGQRFSHIIDPRTACPVSDIRSVSVLSPQPEFADAMATALSVLGPDDGLDLVNRLNGIECFILDDTNQTYMSRGLAA